MMMNRALLFTITLTTLTMAPNAFAAKKNLCDDMIESGKSSQDSINRCIAKFGESEYYKEQEAKKKWAQESEAAKQAEEMAKKANIEVKKFTDKDLEDASFGKSFYAIRIDYSNPRKPKDKRITEGDALCKYLGYEKALKSIVSPEIMPDDADKNGLIVDTGFFGGAKKEPELYTDDKLKHTVRKYMELTCARVKDKSEEGATFELRKMNEDLIVMNEWFDAPKNQADTKVNDGPRKPAQSKTPNGYTRPDWVKQPNAVQK